MKGLFILNSDALAVIYPQEIRDAIAEHVDISAPPQTRETIRDNLSLLQDIDFIFSGWGGPLLDESLLAAAPNLKAVFYGAGSIKGIVTDAFWERNIPITSSYGANAVPVSEYALSQILFSLKCGWQFARAIARDQSFEQARRIRREVPGAYGSTVGLVSLGVIGRRVCKLLKAFDVKVIAYDPFVSEETAKELGAEMCSLEDVFHRSDVVSIHTPWLKETEGMITGRLIASMKRYATLINTSRGAVVREDELIEVLCEREDLFAVLDVTWPEPPVPGSPLYSLPNVVLTPHIAGSVNAECARMGGYVVEELKRYLRGEPLQWRISRERAAIMA
jgi:phosphoglycerate dehydrogenase-like enzyme